MSRVTSPSAARAERLLAALPALFGKDPFVGHLLAPFERMLLRGGEGENASDGLETTIDRLHELFDPQRTPERFLPWLASWVGVERLEGLDPAAQRRFVAAAVVLARSRGTSQGLQRVLQLTTGGRARVTEPSGPDFQIGVHSTIGIDTYLEGPDLHWFRVELSLPEQPGGESGASGVREDGDADTGDATDAGDAAETRADRPDGGGKATDANERARRIEQLARRIIEWGRPAHTSYVLTVSSPGEE